MLSKDELNWKSIKSLTATCRGFGTYVTGSSVLDTLPKRTWILFSVLYLPLNGWYRSLVWTVLKALPKTVDSVSVRNNLVLATNTLALTMATSVKVGQASFKTWKHDMPHKKSAFEAKTINVIGATPNIMKTSCKLPRAVAQPRYDVWRRDSRGIERAAWN